jgi:hypothetical protein
LPRCNGLQKKKSKPWYQLGDRTVYSEKKLNKNKHVIIDIDQLTLNSPYLLESKLLGIHALIHANP